MTEVAIYQPPSAELATTPPPSGPLDDWILVADQVVRLAEKICTSPFVPDGLRGSVPATAAAILAGRELGIAPMTALANVHVIKGKTGISALLMRALIQAQGHDWEDVEVTDTRAVVRGRRRGETDWTTATFTADQAKRAQIQLGGYPQDKLYARATSRLARRKFADVIAGMPYSAEELEDGPDDVMLADDAGYKADRAAERAAAEPAKPRTAKRRQAGAGTRRGEARDEDRGLGADRVEPSGSQRPDSLHSEGPGPDLPPLPGEDEPDPTPAPTAGTSDASSARTGTDEPRATSGQVGIIARHFERLGFEDEERDQRLAITATIAACEPVSSTKELSQVQAKAVMDTLSRCRDRDALIVLLTAGEAEGQADGEAGDDSAHS